jgi:hypothetical protein
LKPTKRDFIAGALASSASLLTTSADAQPTQEIGDTAATASRLGPLTLDEGLPTPETRQKLYDNLDFQRAVQAVLWAEPEVNNALFKRAMEADMAFCTARVRFRG